MGDLLIRNLDDALKMQLQQLASQNGRSLSDEAISHLRRSLRTVSGTVEQSAGAQLRAVLGGAYWTDEELAAIEAARHEPDRDPPRFDE